MNSLSKYLTVICFFLVSSLIAQVEPLTNEYKKATILELTRLMNDFYVFPEIAKKMDEKLQAQLKAGFYDEYKSDSTFADILTDQLQLVTKDKHLLVRPRLVKEAAENSIDRVFEDHLNRLSYNRSNHGGFNEVKILEGNVGYIDLRNFAQPHEGIKHADSYMQLLSTTDAMIIDLRHNGGGVPEMVQYFCSYFFDKEVHLNSLYFRDGDRTIDFWTQDVNGKKMPEVPLFLIVSDRTFSGAEEFSYNMQTQKRAIIVGQTTRGGANPGKLISLNAELEIFVPVGMAINPVTKTNWEGKGVVPEVITSVEESFSKTHELAMIAAQKSRTDINERNKKLIDELIQSIESFEKKSGEEVIFDILEKCVNAEILEEGMINATGYEYLTKYKKSIVAEAIFKANTMLYPNSANVFDSYAESLVENGKLQEAADSYQKAINIAKTTDSRDLGYYQENLKKVKDRM